MIYRIGDMAAALIIGGGVILLLLLMVFTALLLLYLIGDAWKKLMECKDGD